MNGASPIRKVGDKLTGYKSRNTGKTRSQAAPMARWIEPAMQNVGWIIAQSGESIALFSSDYPHVEGGRNPLGRFESSLADTPEPARHHFYHDNFVDLMGRGLDGVPNPAGPSH